MCFSFTILNYKFFLNVFLTLDTVLKGLDFPIFLHDDGSIREVVKILRFHFFSDSFGGFHTYVIFLILLHLFSVCSIYDPWRGRGRGGGRCGKKEAWQRTKRAS